MNKIYQVLIVDDEPTAREILETHLSKIDVVAVVASCKNATEAFSVLSSKAVDLVFLDINMPEVTGLMFAQAIKGKVDVIFTTAYREYAVEGFEVDAIDYLMKPISLDRLLKAVQKFISTQEESAIAQNAYDFTFFKCDRKMVKINFQDILYVESCGDYIKIYTLEKNFTTRETMKHISEKLSSKHFLRTHRSFIVALSKIDDYTNEHITIGRAAIPISRSYKEIVLTTLQAL